MLDQDKNYFFLPSLSCHPSCRVKRIHAGRDFSGGSVVKTLRAPTAGGTSSILVRELRSRMPSSQKKKKKSTQAPVDSKWHPPRQWKRQNSVLHRPSRAVRCDLGLEMRVSYEYIKMVGMEAWRGPFRSFHKRFISLSLLRNTCSEEAHTVAHLFTQWGFWTVFQALVYSLWEKMVNEVNKSPCPHRA